MFDFRFADIGEGIHEGTLLKWFFKEGDEVKEGDSLFLVETDKVNAEIPSPVSGKISKLMADIGDVIHVGDVVVKIDDGVQSNDKSQDNDEIQTNEPLIEGEKGAGVVGEIEVSSEVIESSEEGRKDNESINKRVLATPVARKLAKDLGIDINTVKGTGPVGRVMKEDIYRAKESSDNNQKISIQPIGDTFNKPQVVVPEIKISGDIERVSISRLRKTIAENMVLSKSIIPHATTMDDFDVSALVKLRNEQKDLAKEQGVNLTYMPFIIKALAKVLKEFPVFNSSYDDKNEEIILKKYYNIGIATDTADGLMVPVIENTDKKGILELAADLESIAAKARNKTIS